MNDVDNESLKSAMRAELDTALPRAGERRDDLARLTRVRPTRRTRLPALFAGVVTGALGVFVATQAPGYASLASSRDDGGPHVSFAHQGKSDALVVDGNRAAYFELIRGSLSSHALPAVFGQKIINLRADDSGLAVVATFAHALPGITVVADRCIDEQKLAVDSMFAPAQVVLDAMIEKLDVTAKVDGATLTLACKGAPSGDSITLTSTTQWPPPDPILDSTVDVVAREQPLSEVLQQIGAQVKLPSRYGPKTDPRVSIELHRVSLKTALGVLRETTQLPVQIGRDDHGVLFVQALGMNLPDFARFVADAEAKEAAAIAEQRRRASSTR